MSPTSHHASIVATVAAQCQTNTAKPLLSQLVPTLSTTITTTMMMLCDKMIPTGLLVPLLLLLAAQTTAGFHAPSKTIGYPPRHRADPLDPLFMVGLRGEDPSQSPWPMPRMPVPGSTGPSGEKKSGPQSSRSPYSNVYYAPDETGDDPLVSTEALGNALRWIPFFLPAVAYNFYDPVAHTFTAIIDLVANRNWVAVDGGAYQGKIIAPAINGIVVPSVSILFATLIGTTISTLRQRQLSIRTSFNLEAGQLRVLQGMVDALPSSEVQTRCRSYLTQYTSRIIAEGRQTTEYDSLDLSIDCELNGVLQQLNAMSVSEDCPAGPIMGQGYTACNNLIEERTRRISAMQSTFPTLHYVIVTVLASAILVAFLMETNQELLVFLNAVQLRMLWSILVGTFSALAVVIYDLSDPFTGSYQVAQAVEQLHTIRMALSVANNDKSKLN
mmetsp:Transcript_18128/g.51610  ORF Transcript_18128/g.51610 Transcript_18128/m.51610 type:complete len:442 (+) Transcript_18128:2-1327(+)